MGDQMNVSANNLYGALGSYEKSVRDRKFRIAVIEDTITNLKASLNNVRTHNKQLKSKCETLQLEYQVQENRYISEVQRKSQLELQLQDKEQEYNQIREKVERQKKMIEKIENFKLSRIATLKKVDMKHMEQYRQIPIFQEYLSQCDKEEDLKRTLERKSCLFQEKQEEIKLKSAANWKEFVSCCIKIAKAKNEVEVLEKETERITKELDKESSLAKKMRYESPIENLHNKQYNTKPQSSVLQERILNNNTKSVESLRSNSLQERLNRIRCQTRRYSLNDAAATINSRVHSRGDIRLRCSLDLNNGLEEPQSLPKGECLPSIRHTTHEKKESRMEMKLKEIKMRSFGDSQEEPIISTQVPEEVEEEENSQTPPPEVHKTTSEKDRSINFEASVKLTALETNAKLQNEDKSNSCESSENLPIQGKLMKEITRDSIVDNAQQITVEITSPLTTEMQKNEHSIKATSEVFKIPPPPKPVVLLSKSNKGEHFSNNFFNQTASSPFDKDLKTLGQKQIEVQKITKENHIESDMGFAVNNLNPGLMSIFGNGSAEGDLSNENSPNSESPMMFTFENIFGPVAAEPNHPLF